MVIIGQSTAARAGAHPYRAGEAPERREPRPALDRVRDPSFEKSKRANNLPSKSGDVDMERPLQERPVFRGQIPAFCCFGIARSESYGSGAKIPVKYRADNKKRKQIETREQRARLVSAHTKRECITSKLSDLTGSKQFEGGVPRVGDDTTQDAKVRMGTKTDSLDGRRSVPCPGIGCRLVLAVSQAD